MLKTLSWLALAGFVGCSSFDSESGGPEGGGAKKNDGGAGGLDPVTGTSGPSLHIGADPVNITLQQGASVDVTLSVARTGGLTGPVAFSVTGTTPGLSATAPTTDDAATTAKLTIVADATAKQGHTILTLTGTNDATKIFATTQIDLLVRGPSGSIDTTFADNGKLDLLDRSVTALVPTSDGKLVIVGDTQQPRGYVSRVDANGVPDPTFAGGGTLETPFTWHNVNAVPQADGGLLVVGSGQPQLSFQQYSGLLVMRLTASGGYDPAFDSDAGLPGRHTLDQSDTARSVVIRNLSAFVLTTVAVSKIDGRGSYASDFGVRGRVTFTGPINRLVSRDAYPLLVTSELGAVHVWSVSDGGTATAAPVVNTPGPPDYEGSSPEGKLVGIYGENEPILFRTSADFKSYDQTFGAGGKYARNAHLDEPLDSLVYIGSTLYSLGVVNGALCVSRRLDNGSPDMSFANGSSRLTVANNDGSPTLLAAQQDGRLLVAVGGAHSSVFRVWQ